MSSHRSGMIGYERPGGALQPWHVALARASRQSLLPNLLRYELRVLAVPALTWPALLLSYAALGLGFQGDLNLAQTARDRELLLPLAGVIAVTGLISAEGEHGCAELRRSYPELPADLPLRRAALGAGMAFTLSAAWIILAGLSAVVPALPPIIALLGVCLFAGAATRSSWGASAVAVYWWLLDALSRGMLSGAFFLFSYRWGVPEVGYAVNRVLLVGVGLTLILGCVLIWRARVLQERRRW